MDTCIELCNAYNYLLSMKKIDRIIPGITGNMGGGGRAGIELTGLKILVRQFYEILFFITMWLLMILRLLYLFYDDYRI